MARILSLAVAAVLVTSSYAQIFPLFKRAVNTTDTEECRGQGWENDLVARFTGIFFGDFYTGGSQDILGPLAVKGNFHAPNYIVNANHGSICEQVDSLNSYGLVVGGITDTFNTHVHGSAYLNLGGTIEEILELDNGCIVTDEEGTGLFDFDAIEKLMLETNEKFANFNPTVILDQDSHFTELREERDDYEILTFHTCKSEKCSANVNTESYPNKLFFAEPNWNGVEGPVQIDRSKTYIINVPVTNGDTFEFDTNNPALGFDPCKVIWNFYPVDDDGNYLPDGEFTLIRRTQNQLGGFTLAPRGHIVDGSVGNFAGNIVGLDYTWENLDAGVEIHDYGSAGGDCDQYLGCLPVENTSSLTRTRPFTFFSRTRSRTRTRTWSTTKFPSITFGSTIVTFSSFTEPGPSSGTLTLTEDPECSESGTTTITTVDTVSTVETIVVTTRSTTTATVTSTTTESVAISYTTVSGLTGTETETLTETQLTVETQTNANVETVTSSEGDITSTSTSTETVAIVFPTTTALCTRTTNTIYSECGTVEVCSSVIDECESEDEHHHHHDKDEWEEKHKEHHHGKDEECFEGNV